MVNNVNILTMIAKMDSELYFKLTDKELHNRYFSTFRFMLGSSKPHFQLISNKQPGRLMVNYLRNLPYLHLKIHALISASPQLHPIQSCKIINNVIILKYLDFHTQNVVVNP